MTIPGLRGTNAHSPSEAARSSARDDDVLARASAVAMRLLVLAVIAAITVAVLARLRLVVLPVLLALVLTTVLAPPTAWLRRAGLPRAAAAAAVLAGALAVLAAVLVLIVPPVSDHLDDVRATATKGLQQVETFLSEQAPGWPQDASMSDQISRYVSENQRRIGTGIATGAILVLEVAAGLLLALVVLFFFLKDGDRLVDQALLLVPPERRDDARGMAARAWSALGGYMRGAAMDGAIEAVVVAVALALLGVPLAVPLAAIAFLAGFVPVVGAIAAGALAALVALVAGGIGDALLVAAVFTAVQQLQNHVLEPLILGRTVRLHPLAIVLSLAAGAVLGGIVGALVAVPLVAVVVAVVDEARLRGLVGSQPMSAP